MIRNLIYLRYIFVLLLCLFLLAACQSGPSEVNVVLTEWGIAIESASVKTGMINFNVLNSGALEHNFIVEGIEPRVDMIFALEEDVLSLTLEPGTYLIMCDLPGHREAGMELEFVVTP